MSYVILLNFIQNIDDIRKISFDQDISEETRNIFLDTLLTHNDSNQQDRKNILLSSDMKIGLRTRALRQICEERDKRILKKQLEEIINLMDKSNESNAQILSQCETYLNYFASLELVAV